MLIKKQVNNIQSKFEASNNKKYKVDSIWDSIVYAKNSIIE